MIRALRLVAILAILTVYSSRLLRIAADLPSSRTTQRFVLGVLIAFLPAAVIGALAHDFIKTVLFETPKLICIMLIIGGIVLLWVDRWALKPRYHDVKEFPLSVCFGIGLMQCLAMIPGTSRSGSTIVGGLLFGADKRSAAEFTFFIALPIMGGAFAYDLYKNLDVISAAASLNILIGFVASFIAGALVVRYLLDFVSRYGFTPFAIWRILVGALGLVAVFGFGLGA